MELGHDKELVCGQLGHDKELGLGDRLGHGGLERGGQELGGMEQHDGLGRVRMLGRGLGCELGRGQQRCTFQQSMGCVQLVGQHEVG